MIKGKLNSKKAPDFDLITGIILKEMLRKAIMHLTTIFNAVSRIRYYPSH